MEKRLSCVPPARWKAVVGVTTALAVLAATWYLDVARPATENVASPSEDREALALWWAPVRFQDVDTTGETSAGGKADYMTSYVYDTNGVLFVVKKPSEPNDPEHGTLKAAITIAGDGFLPRLPEGSDWTRGSPQCTSGTVGKLRMADGEFDDEPHKHLRPWTAAGSRSHGVREHNSEFDNGDRIVYCPNTKSEPGVPTGNFEEGDTRPPRHGTSTASTTSLVRDSSPQPRVIRCGTTSTGPESPSHPGTTTSTPGARTRASLRLIP